MDAGRKSEPDAKHRQVRNLKVLLTTDGTYPCYQGGVSVWCDQLVRHSPEVTFRVLALSYSPSERPVYTMPQNVESCDILPLWGVKQAGWADGPFSQTYRRKIRTTAASLRRDFLGPFRDAIRGFVSEVDPESLAESLAALNEYFQRCDYHKAMTSPEAWDAFLEISGRYFPEKLDLAGATTCMRWLHRYLAVLSVPAPAVDIVHATMSGLAGIPGVLASRKHGSRFVLTEHGILLRELYMGLRRTETTVECKRFLFGFNEGIVRMNVHAADIVTSLCQFNQRWQIRLGADPNKLRITPNGVDPRVFKPAETIVPRERKVVLTMARIYPLKGIDNLLRAAALVRDRFPKVTFRIYGEPADHEYHQLCLGLVRDLHLAEWVEFSQTRNPAAVYPQADIVCVPSVSEGVPYAVLEAMFSGVPVVATDVGGVAETLGTTGLVVKPCDSEALAAALLLLLEGEEAEQRRRDYATAAFARASAYYDIHTCFRAFQNIYKGLISYEHEPAAVSAA
jgi:glycosyltransferase involved in cell wall biosynthesis